MTTEKENHQTEENQQIEAEIVKLEEPEKQLFFNILNEAKGILIRKKFGLNFFGFTLFDYNIQLVESAGTFCAQVLYYSDNHDKSLTNIIQFNTRYVKDILECYNDKSKQKLAAKTVASVALHEIMHVLHRSGIRRGYRDKVLWNIATDHVIDRTILQFNETIKKQCSDDPLDRIPIKYKTKDGEIKTRFGFNINIELDNELPNCSDEEAYEWMYNNMFNQNNCTCQNSSSGDGQESENGKECNCKSKKKYTYKDNGDGTYTITNNKTGEQQTGNIHLNNNSDEDIKNKTENNITRARAHFEIIKRNRQLDKSRGTLSSYFDEYLDKLLEVNIPWEAILKKCIHSNIKMVPDDRSYRSLNKYFRPLGYNLPGVNLIEENDSIGTLVILVDTSGSINSTELEMFAYVIYESMQYFNKIRLITHDVNVHQDVEFLTNEADEFLDYIKTYGFKGRGGTSHQPAFDLIELEYENETGYDFKNELSLVISLTDGYSDIEHILPNYKFVKEKIPIIFVITNNDGFNLGDNLNEVEAGRETKKYQDYNLSTIHINNSELLRS